MPPVELALDEQYSEEAEKIDKERTIRYLNGHENNLWGPLVFTTLTSYDCIVSRDEKLLKQLSPEYWKEVRLYEETELSFRTFRPPFTPSWNQPGDRNKWRFLRPENFMKEPICEIRSRRSLVQSDLRAANDFIFKLITAAQDTKRFYYDVGTTQIANHLLQNYANKLKKVGELRSENKRQFPTLLTWKGKTYYPEALTQSFYNQVTEKYRFCANISTVYRHLISALHRHFSPAEEDIRNTHCLETSVESDSELSDFDFSDSEFEQKVKSILDIRYNSLWLENLIWRTLVCLFRFATVYSVLRILFDLTSNFWELLRN
jgi:hypothetical protein